MVITYAGSTQKSAEVLVSALKELGLNAEGYRGDYGDLNWGRTRADTTLNPDISSSVNKLKMHRLLEEHKVPKPKRFDFNEINSFPIVARTKYHRRGSGYWLCHTLGEVLSAKDQGAVSFLEFITLPREYRVHVFQGKSIRLGEKIWYSDRSDYDTRPPLHNVTHVRRVAKEAVRAAGLDFAAVDILADSKSAIVLETNCAPQLHGSLPKVYARVIADWYESSYAGSTPDRFSLPVSYPGPVNLSFSLTPQTSYEVQGSFPKSRLWPFRRKRTAPSTDQPLDPWQDRSSSVYWREF